MKKLLIQRHEEALLARTSSLDSRTEGLDKNELLALCDKNISNEYQKIKKGALYELFCRTAAYTEGNWRYHS